MDFGLYAGMDELAGFGLLKGFADTKKNYTNARLIL